jgi:hypothetical protein
LRNLQPLSFLRQQFETKPLHGMQAVKQGMRDFKKEMCWEKEYLKRRYFLLL